MFCYRKRLPVFKSGAGPFFFFADKFEIVPLIRRNIVKHNLTVRYRVTASDLFRCSAFIHFKRRAAYNSAADRIGHLYPYGRKFRRRFIREKRFVAAVGDYGYLSQFPHDLLRVIRERENVCKYLDIALQHISDPMLKRMRRRITKQETYELIGRIREEVPGIHLRTTLMVGYPGETDDDYAELMQFAQDVRFERMGAFAYSHEVGTYSYKNHQDDVGEEVKQQRLDTLMRLQQKISTEVQKEKVGKVFKVMLDREEDFYIGRTEYDSPEVDPEVLVSKEQKLQPGKFYAARIESSEAFELYGKIVG